jgi:hypothetical protein
MTAAAGFYRISFASFAQLVDALDSMARKAGLPAIKGIG